MIPSARYENAVEYRFNTLFGIKEEQDRCIEWAKKNKPDHKEFLTDSVCMKLILLE